MRCVCKGGGSANGGKWVPKSERDKRLVGKPGEIKVTYTKHGEKFETKIGEDGYAVKERHWTDHNNPKQHTNPNDHEITWENNHPNFSKHINYWDGNVPEFKFYQGGIFMYDDWQYHSVSEIKESILWGGEVTFSYEGKIYGIFRMDHEITLTQGDQEISFPSVDTILDYELNGIKLRNLLLEAEIISRNV